jgi:zinc transport system ATP-binding protein
MVEQQETTGEVDEVVCGCDRVPVLDRVAVTLPEWQFVGMAGPTGSAKTTLLRLFLQLMHPWRGLVSWVRHNDRGEPISMVYVPQQMAIFKTSVPSTCMEFF